MKPAGKWKYPWERYLGEEEITQSAILSHLHALPDQLNVIWLHLFGKQQGKWDAPGVGSIIALFWNSDSSTSPASLTKLPHSSEPQFLVH